MPLKSGSSRKTISGNIAELHHGKTYKKTKKKFGKKKAEAQAKAIAYSKARSKRKRSSLSSEFGESGY